MGKEVEKEAIVTGYSSGIEELFVIVWSKIVLELLGYKVDLKIAKLVRMK